MRQDGNRGEVIDGLDQRDRTVTLDLGGLVRGHLYSIVDHLDLREINKLLHHRDRRLIHVLPDRRKGRSQDRLHSSRKGMEE